MKVKNFIEWKLSNSTPTKHFDWSREIMTSFSNYALVALLKNICKLFYRFFKSCSIKKSWHLWQDKSLTVNEIMKSVHAFTTMTTFSSSKHFRIMMMLSKWYTYIRRKTMYYALLKHDICSWMINKISS